MFPKQKSFFLLFFFIVSGAFFYFYNFSWGSPFYFHPDERNIASSVLKLNYPSQMNPHFFAYGSLPIYLIYFTNLFVNLFHKSYDLFIQAILIGRFYSAFFSIALIASIYLLAKKLSSNKVAIFTSLLCVLSVGIIQFSHFGTFEIWITFFAVWLFYFSLNLINKPNVKNIFIVSVIFGALCAIKISSLPLLLIPIIAICINAVNGKTKFLTTYLKTILMIFIAILFFIIVSPYAILDFASFSSSINYESKVAFGTLDVFYTGEFFKTIPIIFQFAKIYPFILNPFLTFLFIPAFLYILFNALKNRNHNLVLLIAFYLLLFLPQAFLFAKWTRYIVPTLPFIYLIIAISFFDFIKFLNKKAHPLFNYQYSGIFLIAIINFIFAVSYFITAFVKSDTRIDASIWAKENIPPQSIVLSEIYDMGIVPFNQYLSNIKLFNFYGLDNGLPYSEVAKALEQTEYVILPSQRILKTRLLNEKKFPYGHKFYSDLINGKLGYEKVYETPCDIFCKIIYMGNPVFRFEQTANVFDRPTVFIFKRK